MKATASPWKRRGKRFLVLLGSFAVAGLLLEVGVRAFAEEVPKFPRAVVAGDFGLRINLPDAHYRHKSADMTAWFKINSRGLRDDREFPYAKPAGKKRIVTLGDSFTMGYEVNAEDTFSHVLEAQLEAAGLDVDVLNAGVSGFSNAEELLYLEREMIKYEPDVVIVSYYVNDPRDNLRSGLFGLDEELELVQLENDYIPLGALGDFLNRNPVALWLSQYSEAFALLKERGTTILKEGRVESNKEALFDQDHEQEQAAAAPEPLAGEEAVPEPSAEEKEGHRRVRKRLHLVARIFDRMYAFCNERGIPLVIQSIPAVGVTSDDEPRLIGTFPKRYLDMERPGLYLLPAREFLQPFLQDELLYWKRSHRHWTPFSHHRSGEALAELVLEQGLLSETTSQPGTDGG